MYEMEFQFRNHYKAYKGGIYNSSELLFLTIQVLKGFQFFDVEVKELVKIVQDAVIKADWRKDSYVYDGWSRQAHFGFLSKYEDSAFWHIKKEVNVYDEIETSYHPMEVIKAIKKHWKQLYTDPCLYPALIHLLEASTDLLTPKDFDRRIRYFICRATRTYDASRGLTQKEYCEANSFEWIREHPYSRPQEASRGKRSEWGRSSHGVNVVLKGH